MCHSAHEGPRDHPYHVVDLIVIQGKCCYAMPAPNGSIRDRCVSTRSSNFGADKSVTVPARASRIRAKSDMIDG
jgi:hypothetical protein